MHKKFKVIIVGGGAAGLFCAVELTNKCGLSGQDVLILEKNDRVGKKLLSTGNGQGNLYNRDIESKYYHGEKEFVNEFCELAKKINLKEYLYSLGIPTFYADNGRAYPLSRQASSVLDIVREILAKREVNIYTQSPVESIKIKDKGYEVSANNVLYQAEKVVLAFGGAAQKQFGTDGSSFELVRSLGYRVSPLYPALVQLKTSLENIRGLKGLKEKAKVSVVEGDREIASYTGDILFTEFGVSGSAVFQVSSYIKGLKNPKLKIEFLPDLTLEETEKIITYRENLDGIGQDKLIGLVVKRIGQAVQKSARSTSGKDLAFALKNFVLDIKGDLGFNYAQVTKGGVLTEQVNAGSFESKKSKGIYLVGELLDVDGDCGGYNLAFAFASGIACAKAIKEEK